MRPALHLQGRISQRWQRRYARPAISSGEHDSGDLLDMSNYVLPRRSSLIKGPVEEESLREKNTSIEVPFFSPVSSDSETNDTVLDCRIDVESRRFQLAVGMLIIANVTFQGLETYYGEEPFSSIELAFTLMFTAELVLRVCHFGCPGYWYSVENWFDLVLIVGSWLSLVAFFFFRTSGSIRELRGTLAMLRTFRVMRVLRLFTIFHELHILLKAFGEALRTVTWVSLMALAVNYMCAVFVTNWVKTVDWGDDRDKVMEWFGSLGFAMRTLFFVMTLAQFDDIVLTMEGHVNEIVLYVVVIAYIVVTAFCMVSLITGILSEKLIAAQMLDMSEKQKQYLADQKVFAEEVGKALRTLDTDGDGFLSLTEVKHADIRHLQRALVDLHCIADLHMTNAEFAAFVDYSADLIGVECPVNGKMVGIDRLVNALESVRGQAQGLKLWEHHVAFDAFKEKTETRFQDLTRAQDEIKRSQDGISRKLDMLLSMSSKAPVHRQ